MKIYIFLILAVLFWSGNFILGRYVHGDIDPLSLSLFRWSIVLIILSPYIFIKRVKIFTAIWHNFRILFFLGALGIAGFNTILYYGLQDTTATNALLINSSIPILIIALNLILLKAPIVRQQVFGIILSTLGVVFLIIKGDISHIFALEFNKGDMLIIVSSFVWAFYSIFIKYKPKELNPFEFISAITLIGVVMLYIIYYWYGPHIELENVHYSFNVYITILYMAIFPSLLSFYFWNKGIIEIGANKTGQFTHLMVPFGVLFAYIFLNESIKMYHIYGSIMIAGGIYLSLFYKIKK